MDIRTFDRAAYLASIEPPRFRDGAVEYIGRVLSAEEWFRHEATLKAAERLEGVGIVGVMREITDAFFPPPPWYTRLTRVSVWTRLRAMPLQGQLAAFQSFVAAQVTAQYGTAPGPTPTQQVPESPNPSPSESVPSATSSG